MSIITTAALASWLGIPDSKDDSNLATAAAAANRLVQSYCGRTFEVTTTESASARVFSPRSPNLCYTDDFWTTTALVVKTDETDNGTYTTTLTINTDFIVEPVNGREDGLEVPYYRLRSFDWSFPTCNDRPSVQVTAAWGWESVPAEVTQMTLLQAARWFKRKDAVEGILGGFQDFNAVNARISRYMDPDVELGLRAYRTARAQKLVV
jgi:type II secretory pathway pseudopilin PulG